MNLQELVALCDAPVAGLDGAPVVPDHIYLTVQKRSPPRERIRLAGRSGPLGRVCTARERADGFAVVAVFNRREVRDFAAVSESLAGVVLPHVDQVDESDMNLLSRLALDLDAIAKPADGRLIVAKRGESLSVSGEPMPTVPIRLSDVSSWRVSRSQRETAGQVVAIWHDLDAGEPVECVAGSGAPIRRLRQRYPSREAAQRAADAEFARSARAGRALQLQMPGNADLVAGGLILLVGFRSYADGPWLVTRVEHSLDGSGYRCSVVGEPRA